MNYFFICLYTLTVQLLRDVPTDWKPGSSCTTMRWSLRWNSGISGKNGGRLPCMCQIFIYIYICMYVCTYVCMYVDINNCPFSTSIDRWFPIGTSQCVFQDGSLSTADELRLLLSKRDKVILTICSYNWAVFKVPVGWWLWGLTFSNILLKTLKDRITPHVTNFSRFRLGIEKEEGKRKYKSDGAVMVGEFVCVYVQVQWVSEWVGEWVSEWVVCSVFVLCVVCCGLCIVCCALCFVGCVLLCVVCYVLWERCDVSLGRKVVVDFHGLPLTSPPPANVVSARPKPNRLVRTKASTSVLKQVGTYLHMYCKRLSQLREHLWSVPADR